jgi:hypothetical protein
MAALRCRFIPSGATSSAGTQAFPSGLRCSRYYFTDYFVGYFQ